MRHRSWPLFSIADGRGPLSYASLPSVPPPHHRERIANHKIHGGGKGRAKGEGRFVGMVGLVNVPGCGWGGKVRRREEGRKGGRKERKYVLVKEGHSVKEAVQPIEEGVLDDL